MRPPYEHKGWKSKLLNQVIVVVILLVAMGILAALSLGAYYALKPKFSSSRNADVHDWIRKQNLLRNLSVSGSHLAQNDASSQVGRLSLPETSNSNDIRPSEISITKVSKSDSDIQGSFENEIYATPSVAHAITSQKASLITSATPSEGRTAADSNQKQLQGFGKVAGIDYREGYLYVPSYQTGKINVLNTPSLETLKDYTCPGCSIYDAAALSTGEMILVHGDQRKITKMGPDGQIRRQIDIFYATKGVAVSAYDDIFVLSRSHEEVQVYDTELNHIGRIVIPQKVPGDCNFLAVNQSDVIFVSCQEAVYAFTIQAELLYKLLPPQGVSYAVGIDIDTNGNILVVRRGQGVVDIYDKNGDFVESVGESGKTLWSDIAVGDGYLYAVDYIDAKIKVFKLYNSE